MVANGLDETIPDRAGFERKSCRCSLDTREDLRRLSFDVVNELRCGRPQPQELVETVLQRLGKAFVSDHRHGRCDPEIAVDFLLPYQIPHAMQVGKLKQSHLIRGFLAESLNASGEAGVEIRPNMAAFRVSAAA